MNIVSFNSSGREPFWDVLKGLCIIWVILHHCLQEQVKDLLLFSFWGEAAVPLFITLQSYHFFRKDRIVWKEYIQKMWHRIIKPFLFVEILLLSLHFVVDVLFLNRLDVVDLLKLFVARGGLGWGAYYPWIYIEIALLLPFINYLLLRIPERYHLYLFIFMSVMLEVFCCVVSLKESVYRLLFFRYLFLIYCGLMLFNEGLKMGKKEWLLSMVSILFIIQFKYIKWDLSPFFYTKPDEWIIAHWICYFYVVNMLLYVIYKFFLWIRQFIFWSNLLASIGKGSFEIFLFQMCYFSFFPPYAFKVDSFSYCVYIMFSLLICMCPYYIKSHSY